MRKKENLENSQTVTTAEFCSRLNLTCTYSTDNQKIKLSTCNISRPGLFLTGFEKNFVIERIQVLGEQEMAYLKSITKEECSKALDSLFCKPVPCIIISSGLKPTEEMVTKAKKYSRPLLCSLSRSTTLLNELSIYLNSLLAPIDKVHGVLAEIYGTGVLIIGKSGVGKSETMLELLHRNHQLVADDAVCIKRVGNQLVGYSPDTIRHFMEIRGLGIIDISKLFGVGAVLEQKEIDLIINLEDFDKTKEYNRLGDKKEYYEILGISLPMLTIPVSSGRNLAVILEVAVRNYRLLELGYCALDELKSRIGNN